MCKDVPKVVVVMKCSLAGAACFPAARCAKALRFAALAPMAGPGAKYLQRMLRTSN